MTETVAPKVFKRPGPRQIVWAIITMIFIISLVFSVLAVQNYTEIARAKILSYVATDETETLAFDSSGSLESVNLTLQFTIVNPSHKELKIWVLTYKSWLRDISMEDGTDTSRWRVDGRLDTGGAQRRYYPVFATSYSFDNPAVIVPPMSNMTIIRYLEVNQGNYPDILSNIASINNYTSALGKDIEWLHYTSAILFTQGMPQSSGINHDADLIRRFDGVDITPGVGGAGP
jgi:hypothetical protein